MNSWELTNTEGVRVKYANSEYDGSAPGTQFLHEVNLRHCEKYRIKLFGGGIQAWENGLFELITDNNDFGTLILDDKDSQFGKNTLVSLTIDEGVKYFTIPCKPDCSGAIVAVSTENNCTASIEIPWIIPKVCFPNSNHAQGCEIKQEIFFLNNGNPFDVLDLGLEFGKDLVVGMKKIGLVL